MIGWVAALGLVLTMLVPASARAATSKVDPAVRALLAAPRDPAARPHLPGDAAGRVQLLVEVAAMTAGLHERLHDLGCRIERQRHDLLQVWVPRAAVEEIAALPEVRRVRLADAVTGNRVLGAKHSTGREVQIGTLPRDFGSTGRGIVVGVISIGVAGLAEIVQRGWLPATMFWCRDGAGAVRSGSTGCAPGETLVRTAGGVTARSFRDDGDLAPSHAGGAEGTAVLELVHRLAPDAELWFVNVATGLDLLDAIDALSANVDVLVSDIIVHTYFPDGRSVIAQTVAGILADSAARVRAFVQPVGNLARAHYAAPYEPSAAGDDRGRLHLFRAEGDTEGPRAPAARRNGGGVKAMAEPPDVRWYDNPSAGMWSEVCYTIRREGPGPGSAMLNVTIIDPSGQARHTFDTEARSLLRPADARGPLVVLGAVPVFAPDRIETFSSRGPTFDSRPRPHIVAVDRLRVSGSGAFETKFAGTSAAAAYAGGLAALLLELDPRLDARDLQAVLTRTAIPLGGSVTRSRKVKGRQ